MAPPPLTPRRPPPSWWGDWRPWRFRIAGTRLTGGFRVIDDLNNGDTVSLHEDVDDANRVAELLNRGWRRRNRLWELHRLTR